MMADYIKTERRLLINRIHATIKVSTPKMKEAILKDIYKIETSFLLSPREKDNQISKILDISCGFKIATGVLCLK